MAPQLGAVTQMATKQLTPPETGFQIDKRLSLREWLNHEIEDGPGEYVHLFPDADNRVLWAFRSYKETGDKGRLVTHVPLAGINLNERLNPVFRGRSGDLKTQNRPEGEYRFSNDKEPVSPRSFYLTGGNAENLMAALDLFSRHPEGDRLAVTWYGDDGKGSTAGSGPTSEALYLGFSTGPGVANKREVLISNMHNNVRQMMARFPDD